MDISQFDLSGKTILISGASSGIGKACALAVSRAGSRVILVARNEARLKKVYEQLEGLDHRMICQDLTDYNALENLIDSVAAQHPIFGFIHAAGIELTLPLRNMRPADYEKQFAINVTAGFELARLISKKKYRNPDGGSYVFISSTMGLAGQSGLTGYCSSKGALISGARAMAVELALQKIRVNCVCPGHVEGTLMSDHLFSNLGDEARQRIIQAHPMGLGTPEDVANACVFLLSDAARWITGTALPVDGGYTTV